MDKYYEYGGMIRRQNTKSHICNDKAMPLCGVKSNWMEAGEPINGLYVEGTKHLNMPLTDPAHQACKKCLKKYLTLINITTQEVTKP